MDKEITINESNKKYAALWLFLGITSLAIAGLFAIIVASARSPHIQNFFPVRDIFKTSLIIHVNLSVTVWFIAFGGVLWSIFNKKKFNFSDIFLFFFSLIGVLLLITAPFSGEGESYLNNYIPVLDNKVFFYGLTMFGLGIFVYLISLLISILKDIPNLISQIHNPIKFGIFSSIIITIIAYICFIYSFEQISRPENADKYSPQDFFDILFWGGGHVIQFTYIQLMLVCWLVMNESIGLKLKLSNKILTILLSLNLIFVIPSFYPYFAYEITDPAHKIFFTTQMRHGGGTVSGIIGFFIIIAMLGQKIPKEKLIERNCLISSIILFGTGGVIGFLISEINVTVPAHYHGSIVGVTLAFMGMTYYLMPKLGFTEIKGKIARWQPFIYSAGQLMHIIGLAWSGGYGVLRKSPEIMLISKAQISMGLMGLGGLLSIIGGLLFVIVVFTSIFKSPIFLRLRKSN